MLKRIIVAIAAAITLANFAFAAVDINQADRKALDTIKDIGPKTADAIISERNKGGNFKDWTDLIHRVKGIGPNNASKMSASGLTVNGQSYAGAPTSALKKKLGEKTGKTDPKPPAAASKPVSTSTAPKN